MVNSDIIGILKKHPFFKYADDGVIAELADSPGCHTEIFETDGVIYSAGLDAHRLGYIISGKAAVYSADRTRDVLLRQLTAGDITGVANIFADTPFVSRITATARTKVLFIEADAFGKALEADKKLMYAYINFLSDKIRFLNSKIVYLTAGSAERRLAVWINSYSDSDFLKLPINLSSLAELLNLGRASLYRAFDTLTGQGFIEKSGKFFKITDRAGMIEKYIDSKEV